MTIGPQSSLVVLAALALALPSRAHEVDCTRLAGLAVEDAGGSGPLLDADGLPSLATPFGSRLFLDRYPAVVAFEDRIHNLATEPSVLTAVTDALPAAPARIRSFGDVLAGTIPVGGTLRRLHTVVVTSQKDCLDLFPQDPPEGAWCGGARENPLLVTTESNLASCRAHVVCAPQAPPPPRPPEVCVGPAWTGSVLVPVGSGPSSFVVSFAYDVAAACDGSTWIAGSAANLGGPLQSVLRFDRTGQFSAIPLGDAATTVRLDRSGFLIVTGRTLEQGTGVGAALRQLDQAGTLRWQYDPADFVAGPGDARSGTGADVDAASNVYFAYRTVAAERGSEIALVKLTREGNALWTRQLGTAGDDELGRVVVAPDGGIYVGGTTTGAFPGEKSAGGADAFLAHLDPDGNVRWVRQLGTAAADGGGVALAPDGSRVVLYGTAGGAVDGGAPPLGPPNAFVASFDPSGGLHWLRELRTAPPRAIPPDRPYTTGAAAAVDESGAVWLGGVTGDTGDVFGGDAYVARYDAAGNHLWSRRLAAGSTSELSAIAIDPAGTAIATRNARGGPSLRVVDVIRLSPDGT